MLDLKLLQKNPEVVAAALAKRHSPLNMRVLQKNSTTSAASCSLRWKPSKPSATAPPPVSSA